MPLTNAGGVVGGGGSGTENSLCADAELYWKQRGNICTFKAFSSKRCHEINANKNAILAVVPRLSFIPDSCIKRQ